MMTFRIRYPEEQDVEQLGDLDFGLQMYYLYHGDYDAKNMFCAVDGEDRLLGVAHLTKHDTFDAAGHEQEPDFVRYLTFDLILAERPAEGAAEEELKQAAQEAAEDAVKNALVEAVIRRAGEIKAEYPHKRIVLARYVDADDLEELDYYLRRSFIVHDTIAIFKFDLTKDIPSYPLPEGITIKSYAMDGAEVQNRYNRAEIAAFDGVAWSINHLRWMQGTPDIVNFGAFSGEELLGNTSTWRITEERSATENVFVTPDWQKKGIARNLLTTALSHLKEQGKTMATLGTHGTNRKAMRLYTQVGYELFGFRLTLGYDLQ